MKICILAAAAALTAGCATQDTAPIADAGGGKYLVYRDSAGNAFRQFDYPDDAFCRRVQNLAGRGAVCQPTPAAGLGAHAVLRYNPPGVLVHGHYADLARCQADTAVLSAGVQIIEGCSIR